MKWKMTTTVVATVTVVLSMGAGFAPAATKTTTAATKTTTAAPTVTTLAASNVTSTSATFNGTANPNGLATSTWFQWQPADGDTNTVKAIGSGTSAVSISVTVTGLKAGTAYKYQAAAWNSKGTKYGSLVTFTTPGTVSKTIYLTFDDGPTPGYDANILTALQAAGARATFFEIGQSTYSESGMCPPTNQWPATPVPTYATCLANASTTSTFGNYALVRQILADGNQIGTHSWDHPDFQNITTAQAQTEISQARALQVAITGVDTKIFRYPYFDASSGGDAYLSSQGMVAEGDTIDPSDWDTSVTDAQVTAYVMKYAADGAVVDLHDGQDVIERDQPVIGSGQLPLYSTGGTPGFLPSLLSQLKAAGYSFGVLSTGYSPVTQATSGAKPAIGVQPATHTNVTAPVGKGG